jgi:hypothetical protein
MTEAEQIMKRCQVGTRNYDEANNLHADCYRVIGKLLETIAELESQKPVALKLMPRDATDAMLKAMDECSTEGYDERLYAGHAASVYMAAWDASDTHPPQRTEQEPVALETVYETIIQWDESGGKRSRRELARRIIDLYSHPPQRTKVVFPTMLRKMWSGGEVQAWLDENVNKEKS